MKLSPIVKERLQEICAALRIIDDSIDDLVGMGSHDTHADDSAVDMLTHHQDNIQEFLDAVEKALDAPALPSIPIMPAAAVSAWHAAWQRAWPDYERMAFQREHQVVLKMGNQWLIVSNATNIREPTANDFVFIVGIATVADDGASQLVTNKALLTEPQVFQFFLNKGYGVSDESPWRTTLADAERSWVGAWAACDEWNQTHEDIWRCHQIQAEAPCCNDTQTTKLCVNRTPAGLYEPGFYEGGNVCTVKHAIPESEILDWYDSYDHKVDFRHDLAWEIALAK